MGPRLLAAPDKFRGTARAGEVAGAVAAAAERAGWTADTCPLADGGEGTLEAFGGGNRRTQVTGPDGSVLTAPWRLDGDRAVLESAQVCGLLQAGGPDRNDPVAATSRGIGELLVAALEAGARTILIGLGGSATTDGGRPAVTALHEAGRQRLDELGVQVLLCCDVTTPFTEAARVFGPQKGADAAQVRLLTQRLRELRARYLEQTGTDVEAVPGSGAAGGLAGGLVALGARTVPGFGRICDEVGFDRRLEDASLVITGEGRVDATSFNGKVVGGVRDRARRAQVPLLIVAGAVDPGVDAVAPLRADPAGAGLWSDGRGATGTTMIDLSARFGPHDAMQHTVETIEHAVFEHLKALEDRRPAP